MGTSFPCPFQIRSSRDPDHCTFKNPFLASRAEGFRFHLRSQNQMRIPALGTLDSSLFLELLCRFTSTRPYREGILRWFLEFYKNYIKYLITRWTIDLSGQPIDSRLGSCIGYGARMSIGMAVSPSIPIKLPRSRCLYGISAAGTNMLKPCAHSAFTNTNRSAIYLLFYRLRWGFDSSNHGRTNTQSRCMVVLYETMVIEILLPGRLCYRG
ncbi:hypothetical protein L21_1868 [Methanoculleus chikugoensis]|uniref:Uncharacterized protein n=1 Tax=Methanoculleus chikugoensis TaxID=118126 RepID=A0A1M4MM15_9EURY|nr:hypothetical protein L21_1868 [Methanoculleus chikugoensis]